MIQDLEIVKKETLVEVGKFAVLIGLFEKEKCDYGRQIDLTKVAKEIEDKKISTKELATAIRGRVDLYEKDVEVYVEYILEDPAKVAYAMTETKRKYIEGFINSEGSSSVIGGLIAIYRIRNNMFHGIKQVSSLNNQIELFKAMNKFLQEVLT